MFKKRGREKDVQASEECVKRSKHVPLCDWLARNQADKAYNHSLGSPVWMLSMILMKSVLMKDCSGDAKGEKQGRKRGRQKKSPQSILLRIFAVQGSTFCFPLYFVKEVRK